MKRSLGALLVVMTFALSAGCAHQRELQKKDQTICPEFRDQVCVGGQDCTMDSTRGCRVCQCAGDERPNFTPTSDPNFVPRH